MTRMATVQAAQKWEYQCLTKKTEVSMVRELNDLGQHGWESVCAGQSRDRAGELAWTAFIKRPHVSHQAAPRAEQAAGSDVAASEPQATAHPASHEPPVAPPTAKEAAPAPSDTGFDLDGEEFKIREEP